MTRGKYCPPPPPPLNSSTCLHENLIMRHGCEAVVALVSGSSSRLEWAVWRHRCGWGGGVSFQTRYRNWVRAWIEGIAQTPWPESASELYQLRDCRLSAKLVPTFVDKGVSRSQRGGSLRPYSGFSRPESLHFLPSSSSIVLTRLSGPRSRPTTSQKIW
jgi:hypothetical protein